MTTLGSSGRSTAQLVAIWSALPIAVLFILWAFLTGLNLSFWHDEAWTIINYVEPGPAAIFAGEYVPNNHMLFSLLAWLTTTLERGHRDSRSFLVCRALPGHYRHLISMDQKPARSGNSQRLPCARRRQPTRGSGC